MHQDTLDLPGGGSKEGPGLKEVVMRHARNFTTLMASAMLLLPACGGSGGGKAEDAIADTQTDTAVQDHGTDQGGAQDAALPDSGALDRAPQDLVDALDAAADVDSEVSTQQNYLMADQSAAKVPKDLVHANNRFAVELFKRLNQAEGPMSNVFISPLSASAALSMAYAGATSETKDAMASTLHYSGMDFQDVLDGWHDLLKGLDGADADVALAMADSCWIDEQFKPEVRQAYLDLVAQYFLADVFTLDLQGPDALDTINGWVSEKTKGMITELIDQIPDVAVMYLINAIYFKGTWVYPFPKDKTHKAQFALADGTTKEVDMMQFDAQVQSFEYYCDEQYCIVRMPYGRDKIAFYGIVPWGWDEQKSIEDFITDMTYDSLKQSLEAVKLPEGEYEGIAVFMPRFEIEYKKTLNDALQALGMGPAFEGGFDDIAKGIFISRVLQKAVIKVNEEGTEASAATAVEMVTGIPPGFYGNRPFFFVIRDDRNGSILFMGKLANP